MYVPQREMWRRVREGDDEKEEEEEEAEVEEEEEVDQCFSF